MGYRRPLLRKGARALRPRRLVERKRSGWHGVDPRFLAYAGCIVALALSRRRLNLPRPPMVPIVSTVPLAVAAAIPRGRVQYAATWVAYVWLFKVAWEIPYDKSEKLEPRLRVDYPIRFDASRRQDARVSSSRPRPNIRPAGSVASVMPSV